MTLNNKIHLCYVNMKDLWQWIEENDLLFLNQNFTSEKEKWAKEINQQPNFFSDTELLLIYQDTLILKALNDNQISFLAKTYQLEQQNVCQKLFQVKKNIILVSERQWKIVGDSEELPEQQNKEKVIVLIKDQEGIEKSLANWLKETSV